MYLLKSAALTPSSAYVVEIWNSVPKGQSHVSKIPTEVPGQAWPVDVWAAVHAARATPPRSRDDVRNCMMIDQGD